MPNYYPKAGRCRACLKQHANCSHLPFHTMPVHRRDGQDVSVICTDFQSANQIIGRQTASPEPQDHAAQIETARARLAKAEARAAGQVKYTGQTCYRCDSSLRYAQTGNCVECTIHRQNMRRESNRSAP